MSQTISSILSVEPSAFFTVDIQHNVPHRDEEVEQYENDGSMIFSMTITFGNKHTLEIEIFASAGDVDHIIEVDDVHVNKSTFSREFFKQNSWESEALSGLLFKHLAMEVRDTYLSLDGHGGWDNCALIHNSIINQV